MSASRALAAVGAAVVALSFVPGEESPLRRLAGGAGDGPDPRFDVPLNAQALKNTALPDGALYATYAPDESPLAQGNLKAAGQLYLAHLLPVQDRRRASVVFTYRDGLVR